MTIGDKLVRLSEQQLTYLRTSGILAKASPQISESITAGSEEARDFQISRDDAEQIRSVLTDHLARVGFNSEYGVTSEGKILEELIDQFYQ